MTINHSDNRFLLPKIDGSLKFRDEFSKKKLKQWIDGLPISDVERAAPELNVKLDQFNVTAMSPASRYELIRLLLPSIEYVLDSLKAGCTDGVAPLDFRNREMANLRLDILVQVVKAYKTVLAQSDEYTVTGALFHKQIRSEALRGAITYLGEILFHSYVTYRPCISQAWKELHGIYYYSVSSGQKSETEIEISEVSSSKPGIEDIYKRILLLALANPRSMHRGEVERVNKILSKWVEFVQLVPIGSTIFGKSYYLVDAQSDGMPYSPDRQTEKEISMGWYLVTDGLRKKLEEKVAAIEVSQQSMRPTDAGALRLMRKLRDAWSQQIYLREQRCSSSDVVKLVCGFDTIHQVHGGEDIVVNASRRYQMSMMLSNSGHHPIGSPILENDEILIEVEPGALELFKTSGCVGCHLPRRDTLSVAGKECVAINISENGCCLNWYDSGGEGVHVGELVEINSEREKEEAPGANLGVVRWMYAGQPGVLDVGVELLGGLFQPVMLEHISKTERGAETIKGFLHHANGGSSVSLITPPFYVAHEDEVKVITSTEDISVDITNIIESTDSFVRFKLEQTVDVNLVS